MTYGRLPYNGMSREAVEKPFVQGPFYDPEVSESCRDLLKKILCYNPDKKDNTLRYYGTSLNAWLMLAIGIHTNIASYIVNVPNFYDTLSLHVMFGSINVCFVGDAHPQN